MKKPACLPVAYVVPVTVCLILGLAPAFLPPLSAQQAPTLDTSREASVARVTADIKYLASDELAGRLPGTPEMILAENYILEEYKRIGLKSGVPDGSYKQTFGVGEVRTVAPEGTSLVLKGPKSPIELKLDESFKPQLFNKDVSLDAELVFVGYGIRAEDLNYDEYRDLDVKGKVVVLIRKEPQANDANSVFAGTENSPYAFLQYKVTAAREAGAVGILMVNDAVTAPDAARDELAAYDMFRDASQGIPFAHIKREVLDKLLAETPVVRRNGDKLESLSAIEQAIDGSLEPVSQSLSGWRAELKVAFTSRETMTSNLVGVIEGEGPHADETIIIGGHYDHLGNGAFGSRSGPGRIHNGADDNATGTAGVVELARRFAASGRKPGRRLVFICFSAEEMGLLGAFHYVNQPLFPLEKTVSMINFDMIGWLREGKLTAYSWDSSPAYVGVLDRANEAMGDRKLELLKPQGGFAGSDHLPFQQRGIPVMFLHTGLNATYHTPEDDFETINCEGATHVIDFTEKLLWELASLEEAPKFVQASPGGARTRVRLDALLTDAEGDAGVLVESVTEEGLAARSGLAAGDMIVAIDGEKTTRRREVVRTLNASKGKTLKLTVKRGDKEVEVAVEIPNDE